MHSGKIECHVRLGIAAELQQLGRSGGIVQVSETVVAEFSFYFNPGCIIEVVIGAQVVLIQQQVNLFAAVAAEVVVVLPDPFRAGVAAMVTFDRYGCGGFYNGLFLEK